MSGAEFNFLVAGTNLGIAGVLFLDRAYIRGAFFTLWAGLIIATNIH